jgi:uncharacterized hydrophobic protein (TIGR00341 family)
MADRLVEIIVPKAGAAEVLELLDGYPLLGRWPDEEAGRILLRVLLPAEEAEPALDRVQQAFDGVEGFRIVLLPVTATLPRIPADEREAKPAKRTHRISREELYAEAAGSIRTSPVFIALTVLSAVVASAGLLGDNLAVVIGAMMIAPLLAPNVALAMGTTLGDLRLIRDAMKANLVGVSIALMISVAVGVAVEVDPAVPAIAVRTAVTNTDLILALAAGAAGTLAFTSGLPSAVIGVMVAVALLPPLVNFGLLVGGGHPGPASGAFLLLVANVVCVNLAGVLTFLAQGVRPRTWWEAERARASTRIATILWASLLALLALTLLLARPGATP